MHSNKRLKEKQGSELQAGAFSAWLAAMSTALKNNQTIPVPCGDCTACCASSQFIHIRPDESRTLAKIPNKLLFPAPGLPEGHVLLGYDKKGFCPMFKKGRCSIYDDRPLSCRMYDCRIFPATGIPVDRDKTPLAIQVGRWKFDFPNGRDRALFSAVRAAANFLRQNAGSFPMGFVPNSATGQTVLAIRVYEVFLGEGNDPRVRKDQVSSDKIVSRIIAAFDKY